MNKKLLYTVLMLISVAALVGGALIGVNMMDSFDEITNPAPDLITPDGEHVGISTNVPLLMKFVPYMLILSAVGFAAAAFCSKKAPDDRARLSARYLKFGHLALFCGTIGISLAVFMI